MRKNPNTRQGAAAEQTLRKAYAKTLKPGTYILAKASRTRTKIKGKVMAYNERTGVVTIETPQGLTKTVNIVNFIITILPLVDILIAWVSGHINKILSRKRDRTS